MNFGVRQLSLGYSKLLSICDTKKENAPAPTTAPVAPAKPVRPPPAAPARTRTVVVTTTVVKSSSPAKNMAEGDSAAGGIIVFTLWYIAIAIGYAMDTFFKPKERYESETNTEVLSVDEIIPKSQDAVRSPSFFTADPPLFTVLKSTASDTVHEADPVHEMPSEPPSPEVKTVSEDSFVEASPSPLPIEEHEPMAGIIAEYVAETQGGEEGISNFESNQEFLHEEIPDAQTEEVTEHVFDIDD